MTCSSSMWYVNPQAGLGRILEKSTRIQVQVLEKIMSTSTGFSKAISILPGTHLHLSQVEYNHARYMCLVANIILLVFFNGVPLLLKWVNNNILYFIEKGDWTPIVTTRAKSMIIDSPDLSRNSFQKHSLTISERSTWDLQNQKAVFAYTC